MARISGRFDGVDYVAKTTVPNLEPNVFFILALVVIPLVAGFVANLVVGKNAHFQNWELFVAGIIGSFVGGTFLNLLINGNFEISISGLLGSIVGAIIVLAVWAWLRVKVIKSKTPG